jgi:hypothetical protein
MGIKLRDTSRLRWSRLLVAKEVEFWDLPEYPEVPAASDDIRYTVARVDRIDLLSNSFYETPDLWWIIATRNELRILPNDLYEGQTIFIPSYGRVFNQILRKPTRGREGR